MPRRQPRQLRNSTEPSSVNSVNMEAIAAKFAAPQSAAGSAAPQSAAGSAAPQSAAGFAAPQSAAGSAAPQSAAGFAAPQSAETRPRKRRSEPQEEDEGVKRMRQAIEGLNIANDDRTHETSD